MSVPNVFCRTSRKYVGDKIYFKLLFLTSKNDPSNLKKFRKNGPFFPTRKKKVSKNLNFENWLFLSARLQSAQKKYFFFKIVRKNDHSICGAGGTLSHFAILRYFQNDRPNPPADAGGA